MTTWQFALPLFLLSLAVVQPAAARPCGQVVPCAPITLEGPIPSPLPGNPAAIAHNPLAGNRQIEAYPGYVQEEFFFSGDVDVFDYDQHPGERGAFPGERLVAVQSDVPYKTRMVVLRPAQAHKFNGTVIVEFMNSTGGRDNAVQWTVSADYFTREGIVFIGVTTSGNQSMAALLRGCGPAPFFPSCGTRYSGNGLVISNNGQEYEIMSQLVTALKSQIPNQIPLPSNFPRVKRVFVTAESQQAGSVITQATQFHFPAIDGYLPLSGTGVRALRSGLPTCNPANPAVPAYPGCVAVPTNRLIRTDLPVPTYQMLTETDVQVAARQDDTDTSRFASYRLTEITGGVHNTDHTQPVPGTPYQLGDFCVNPSNTLASGPIFGAHVVSAYFQNMRLQKDFGIRPPYVARITKDAAGVTQRDALGNPLGGVRLPEMDVPVNEYFSPFNQGKRVCAAGEDPGGPPPVCIPQPFALIGLACALSGSYRPLAPEVIEELYPTHQTYVVKTAAKAFEQVLRRNLLWEEAVQRISDAAESDVGN